jgi:putative Mg2+ transporter-C (MgtC) family protein
MNVDHMTLIETLLRLGVATLLGAIIGLDREAQDKPAGLRTLALVCLAGAFVPVIMLEAVGMTADALSRVMQGILTGVGFLGAGVILQHNDQRVTGLTTAATVWLVAAIGVACGLGLWREASICAALALAILWGGKLLEKRYFPDG